MKSYTGVIGTGNWGTTVAHLIADNGHPVLLWGRNAETVREINEQRTNRKYLKDRVLSDNIQATTELKRVVEQCDLIFVAVPSKAFRDVANQIGNHLGGDQMLISCTKGIEEKTFRLMTDILKEETCCKKVGALSGPNIANEIASGDPSGSVIASRYDEVIDRTLAVLQQSAFKVYGNKDVTGVEIGGALKNIIAIASGVASGLDFKNNSRSFLITRGIAEISRLGMFLDAKPQTFLGLSGIGDLIATCYSTHSRNNTFGRRIAEGKSPDDILKEMHMVVEGVYTTRSVYEFSKKFNIFMPITEGMYKLLFESANVRDVLKELMSVRVKFEGEEERQSVSSLEHMFISKYPSPENLL